MLNSKEQRMSEFKRTTLYKDVEIKVTNNTATMTEKFDPNATPICDEHVKTVTDFEDYQAALHMPLAEDLERRARLAEEKLEIIFGNFDAFAKKHSGTLAALGVEALLNCIEREFELRGVGK
jgi:hypothetical protein